MIDYGILCALASALLATTVAVGAEQAGGGKPADQYIRVEIKGKLQSGVAAIGGETTGYLITARGVTWELDFGNKNDLKKLADGLDGKTVTVKGSYEIRKGVEIKQRHIVTVESLAAAP